MRIFFASAQLPDASSGKVGGDIILANWVLIKTGLSWYGYPKQPLDPCEEFF